MMLPSEQFELAIYRWVRAAGIARPVNIPDFYSMPGSKGEYALVVDRLKDLHAHGYIALSKISGNYSVPYDKFVLLEGENPFFGGGFVVGIAPGGRKFFEGLEAREEQETRSKPEATTSKPVSTEPSELAKLPGKSILLADIQQRLDARGLISIMFADLDGFKAVNDTLGHDEGDICLSRVVEIISAAIAGKGSLYRPGGDEFVVALPNFNRHEAAATAERIRGAIDAGNPGGTLKVTASIGVTDSESPAAADATALFKIADAAMYMAKETKNRVFVDTGVDLAKARTPKSVNTVYGYSDDLQVGTRVQVLEPGAGVPREQWPHSSLVWVIREINQIEKTAKATPVLAPMDGSPSPMVEGPMSGPKSPFLRTNIPG